jgi:hypothetical protein
MKDEDWVVLEQKGKKPYQICLFDSMLLNVYEEPTMMTIL